ncbi:MAG: DUF5522 domain-containing protein [Acidobacteriota bacterium]|nr:DUF5522 domain-containing protein [Acidobacteriota bacterium]
MNSAKTKQTTKQEKLIEGVDYYFENGLMVLTAHFLLKRGYCCGNCCRHCPYPKEEKGTLK